MVSPVRPFKCLFLSVVKQGGKHHFPNLMRVCCWDRDRSGSKLFFSDLCVWKMTFCVRMFRRSVSCEKWVQCVVWWWWGEELLIICDHVYLSHKNEWTQDCSKGAGLWRNLCDSDTGSERSVGGLGFLTITGSSTPPDLHRQIKLEYFSETATKWSFFIYQEWTFMLFVALWEM